MQFILQSKKSQTLILKYEQQFNEHLKSEYEQFKQNIFEVSEEEDDDNDQDNKNYKNTEYNNEMVNGLIKFCRNRSVKFLNDSSLFPQNIKIYFDWDDKFNNIQSLFSPIVQPKEIQNNKSNSEGQSYNQLKVNDKLQLQIIENTSNETDIIFSQSSLINGRFDRVSSNLCYNQIFNHIPGSNFLYGKQNLIDIQTSSTKRYKSNLKCLLELDFFQKVFDLRKDCSSFEDYINIQHLQENKDVYYIQIQGSYNKIYSQFLLNSDKNNQIQNENNKENIFSCQEFWKNHKELKQQPLLVQEISIQSDQNNKQTAEVTEARNLENYFIRVNFLISSTKPLIVYCQNNELVFLKCKYGYKCNKRIKQLDFFKQFPSLNQEILAKKIFKAISHTILSVKPQLLEDSRVFELFTADFSVQNKNTMKLEEIYPFHAIYKKQDIGYDGTQKRFLKESLFILSQQFMKKILSFQQIFNTTNSKEQPSEVVQSMLKRTDRNEQINVTSNFIELIINENVSGQAAYKHISPSCI